MKTVFDSLDELTAFLKENPSARRETLQVIHTSKDGIRYQNDFVNGSPHGSFKCWKSDGKMLYESTYAKGVLHGKRTTYHDNGNVESIAHWRNGIRHGYASDYSTDGVKICEGKFINGEYVEKV